MLHKTQRRDEKRYMLLKQKDADSPDNLRVRNAQQ